MRGKGSRVRGKLPQPPATVAVSRPRPRQAGVAHSLDGVFVACGLLQRMVAAAARYVKRWPQRCGRRTRAGDHAPMTQWFDGRSYACMAQRTRGSRRLTSGSAKRTRGSATLHPVACWPPPPPCHTPQPARVRLGLQF